MEVVEIRSPSPRRETYGVLAAALLVAGIGLGTIQLQAAASRRLGARADLLPYQVLFGDLSPRDQAVVRQVREGLLEIEAIRGSEARWPAIDELAASGAAPFAPDPIDPGAYRWSFRTNERGTNYAGVPAERGRGAFLIVFLPANDQTFPGGVKRADEIHHLLANGEWLHVSLWMRDDVDRLPDIVIADPLQTGWTQVLTAPLSAAPGSVAPTRDVAL